MDIENKLIDFMGEMKSSLGRIEANQDQDRGHFKAIGDNLKEHVKDPEAHPQARRTSLNWVIAAVSLVAMLLGLRHELKGEAKESHTVEVDDRNEPR